MSTRSEAIDAELRDKIIQQPDVILGDDDLMRALMTANDRAQGENIVDIRGVAMERLESRLGRLEETHKSVIAAAYENLAGTNQIHRAILRLLEPVDFEHFLRVLATDVAEIMRVSRIRLVLESSEDEVGEALSRIGGVVSVAEPGFIDDYVTHGRSLPVRQVTLRQVHPAEAGLYGAEPGWVRSEALIKLDFGTGRFPGLIAIGSDDPHHFSPSQGTDLLAFFGACFERAMRRWLA